MFSCVALKFTDEIAIYNFQPPIMTFNIEYTHMKNSITLLKAIAFCFMIIASSQLVAQIGIGVTGAVNSSAAGFLNMAFGIFKNGVLLPESVFLTTNSATATTGLYFIIHVTTPVVASDYFRFTGYWPRWRSHRYLFNFPKRSL